MKYVTYIDVLKPKEKFFTVTFEILLMFVLSMIISFSAQLKIFLPFTPVPITFQTFTVLFIGMLVGAKRSIIVVLMYIFQGIFGVTAFASGSGIGYILGPTGGYILGFLVAGYVVGLFAQQGFDRNVYKTFFAMFIGNLVIYTFGILWLSKHLGGIEKAFMLGVLPFILGDIVKIFIASFILPSGWKFIKKYNILP